MSISCGFAKKIISQVFIDNQLFISKKLPKNLPFFTHLNHEKLPVEMEKCEDTCKGTKAWLISAGSTKVVFLIVEIQGGKAPASFI